MMNKSDRKKNAIQLAKNRAINKIAKIYHPLYKFPYDGYMGEFGDSRAEQRESEISSIIEDLNKEINKIKSKFS